jgi:hypothetical protein
MSSTNGFPSSNQEGNQEELSIAEIIKTYKGKWVAIQVTARDKNLQPTKGKVVADSQDRYLLRQKLIQYKDICIFFAGEPPYPLLL